MTDSTSQTVSNNSLSSNADFNVRCADKTHNKKTQVFSLDIGDGTTETLASSANPLPVALSSSGLVTAANVARGKIVGTSLTGSYADLLVMGGDARQLTLISSCDQTVLVSLDDGTTDSFELDPFESISIDYGCNGMRIASSTIQAKHGGTVPTVGSIRASIARQ